MLMLIGRLYFLAFMLNIVAHFIPQIKQQKWMEFIETITHPVSNIVAELLPFRKDYNLIIANFISGFGMLIAARILKFIL